MDNSELRLLNERYEKDKDTKLETVNAQESHIDFDITTKQPDNLKIINGSLDTNDNSTNSENVTRNDNSTKSVRLSNPFIKIVFSQCYLNINENNAINDVINSAKRADGLIDLVTQTLLNSIPNMILNKREDAIPFLVAGIYLNPKATERDKLLQQLFNLKKRPTESERLFILSGVLSIAQISTEQLVENEILPQCWLQLTHKYLERRLLVAEACTILIPYVSSPIRNSLILSMLQQMIEDKEKLIRNQIIKALSLLISMCEDGDKYSQCEQIALNCILDDTSDIVINSCTQILFPVLARWALDLNVLYSSLLKKLLHKLNENMKSGIELNSKMNTTTIDKTFKIVAIILNLLPFILMSMASNENILNNIEKDIIIDIRPDFSKLCTNLTSPVNFMKDNRNCGTILFEFDKFIYENPNVSWAEIDWIVDVMLPDLFNNLHHIDQSLSTSHQMAILESFLNLFDHICIVFGKKFTKYKIRPLVQKKFENLESVLSSFNQFRPSLNIIPIYLIVLNFIQDYDDISSVLKKFLCALPLYGIPLDCLEVAVKRLCEGGLQEIVIDSLWSGVVHQKPLVRSAAANLFLSIVEHCDENLLKTKVIGAIITLASDNDVLVKTAVIPTLGNLIIKCNVKEIRYKAYFQLETYINDSALKENHTLLRQLIVTLGNMVNSSSRAFRNNVILTQLSTLSVFASEMTNQTRKVDLVLALLEAYTQVVYSPLIKENIYPDIKYGLKCLDMIISENQTLTIHHETISSMIRECENKSQITAANADNNSSPSPSEKSTKLSMNMNQSVEEMRQRVSKMFNKRNVPKSTTMPNLHGIFQRKK